MYDYLIATDEGIASNDEIEQTAKKEDEDLLKEDEDLLKEDEEEVDGKEEISDKSEDGKEDNLFDMSEEEAPSLDSEAEFAPPKEEEEYAISRGIDFESEFGKSD